MLLKRLMGSGGSAGLANAFAADITDNQTATGTTAADALVAGTAIVRCTTVPSGTGVQLINGVRGDSQIIINEGANDLNVYPPSGHTLGVLGVDLPVALPVSTWALFERITNTAWIFNANTAQATSVINFGAIGNGTTDDTAAILAAYAATPTGGTLFFPYAPSGYLITSGLTLAKNIQFIFDGRRGVSNIELPGSYLLKKSTMSAAAITITTNGVRIEGGGVSGQSGNGGDGIVVLANNVVLDQVYSCNNGNDGIRVGQDAAGNNANSYHFIKPVCSGNTRHGIYVNNDNTGASTDANAGLMLHPFTQSNGGDGIKVDRGYGTTIVNPLSEVNTGAGVRAAANCRGMYIFGGDLAEANVGGDFVRDSGAKDIQMIGGGYVANNTDLDINVIVRHVNNSTGAAGLGFNVSATSEGNGAVVKGGFAFQRADTNGRGTLHICNDIVDDTNDFAITDSVAKVDTSRVFSFANAIRPAQDTGAYQTACGIYAGTGAPNNSNGANGDFYFRGDGTAGANTVVYHREAGAWVALVTT